MSTDRLWRTLAILLPALAAVIAPLSTVDLAYHLRAGAEIVATGAIPAVDSWTFTAAGTTWVDQQWGAQLVLHAVHQVGGWTGLVLLRALATGVVVASLLRVALDRGLGTRTATLLVLAAFLVAAPAMALRPQLLGMAAFAIVVLLVTRRRDHPRALWLVPLVVVAWANVHGSFFLTPVVLGLAWLQDVHDRVPTARRTLVVAAAAIVAACVTPFGPAVWLYAVGLSLDPQVTARISEWQPTSLRRPAGLVLFASFAAVVILVARRGRVVGWPSLAWLAVFAGVAIYAERGVAWWAIAAVPPVAALLAEGGGARPTAARTDPPAMRRLNAGLVGVLVLVGVALLPVWRPLDEGTATPAFVLTDAPSGVTGYLRATATADDRILNHQAWGSWLEYAVPQASVAIDSRIELYPAETWTRYERVMAGAEGWEAQVADWGVTLVVVDADQRATADRFAAAGWRPLHEDADGTVLGRP